MSERHASTGMTVAAIIVCNGGCRQVHHVPHGGSRVRDLAEGAVPNAQHREVAVQLVLRREAAAEALLVLPEHQRACAALCLVHWAMLRG